MPNALLIVQLYCLRVRDILNLELGGKSHNDSLQVDAGYIFTTVLNEPFNTSLHGWLWCQNFILSAAFAFEIMHLDRLWLDYLF